MNIMPLTKNINNSKVPKRNHLAPEHSNMLLLRNLDYEIISKKLYLSPSLFTRRYAFVLVEGSPKFLRRSIAASILVSSSFSMLNAQDGSLHQIDYNISYITSCLKYRIKPKFYNF